MTEELPSADAADTTLTRSLARSLRPNVSGVDKMDFQCQSILLKSLFFVIPLVWRRRRS